MCVKLDLLARVEIIWGGLTHVRDGAIERRFWSRVLGAEESIHLGRTVVCYLKKEARHQWSVSRKRESRG